MTEAMSTSMVAHGARFWPAGKRPEGLPEPTPAAHKKLPTPALVEGCLIKAMDGDERCQSIWDRWAAEANGELQGLMLGATLSYANLALAGS